MLCTLHIATPVIVYIQSTSTQLRLARLSNNFLSSFTTRFNYERLYNMKQITFILQQLLFGV